MKSRIFVIVIIMIVRKIHLGVAFLVLVSCVLAQQSVSASTFGAGLYGENVPFGSATSIAISLDDNVDMTLAPSGPNFSGSGSHTITVTSTDVVGYNLYINATSSTAMSNGDDTVSTSANGSPAALSLDSWGYNTSGSTTNFQGISLSQVLLKDANGPYTNGDDTAVTYGAFIGPTKSSGVYTVDVTYTAVGKD